MNAVLRSTLAVAGVAFTTQAAAEITFYEHDGFQGRSFSATREVDNFQRNGFNDLASSVVVRMDRWEVCSDANFGGRCVVLRPGHYDSLSTLGMNDRISSARIVSTNAHVDNGRYAPAPVSDRDYRRRDNERLYEANVTSVRAVVGAPEQRCWVEHEQVSQDRGGANVPGAVVGAVLGGILGHQVGSGRGNDVATVGGAVVGGVVGSNVGRDHGGQGYQDVQRCSTTPSNSATEFWDVTYNFEGQEHHVQLTAPPGRTVTVNAQGEPRA